MNPAMTMNTYRSGFETAPEFTPAHGLADLRRAAWDRFKALDFPTRRKEAWRYVNIERLLNTPYVPVEADYDWECQPHTWLENYYLPGSTHRAVYFNGRFCAKLSRNDQLPQGVLLKDLASALREHGNLIKGRLGLRVEEEQNTFAAINTFSFSDGVFFYVPRNVSIQLPVHLLFFGIGDDERPPVFYPRILIVLEEGARAEIVLENAGGKAGKFFSNAVADIVLGANSKLQIVNIQRDADAGAHQFLAVRGHVGPDASLETITFTQDGGTARNDFKIALDGVNSSCSLRGLALLSGDHQAFYHAYVDHSNIHGTSRQLFKSVLTGRSQSEFDSEVHVFGAARQSDSQQLNRNLLLSRDARAYSRPRLKIDNDDVQCSHGSATGQLEQKELFYLQSRGLSLEVARFVLVYGFAEEVLEVIHAEPLRRKMEAIAREKLEKMIQSPHPST